MPKKNPADIEAERCFAIQERTAHRSRLADTILLILLSLLIAFFGIGIFVLPHQSFSEDENRSLATFPQFSFKALADGSYTSGIGKFYSDQFPARKLFVQLKAGLELAQLKLQNNSVIPAADGTLIKRLEYSDMSYVRENMSAVAEFTETMETRGVSVTVAVAPRSIDVLTARLNPLYGADRSDTAWQVLSEYMEDATYLRDTLAQSAVQDRYVWYRTDHHWTSEGAYEAYVALGDKLGYTPYPLSHFTPTPVADDFYGTTYSSSGLYSTPPDTITYYRFEGDEKYTVENMLTGHVLNGFYDTDLLGTKDKYSSFIGGNNAHVVVHNGEEKPTLVLIKDSFAHSVVPFLALHYRLEIIDLRSFTGSVAALVEETEASDVLILYGADSLAISDPLSLLKYGLEKKAD